MDFKKIALIPPEKIPLGNDVPLDDLMNIYKLAVHMEVICINNQGIGLAATQVGIPYNFFITFIDNHFEYYINCSYEGIGEKINSLEGCLSLRDDDGNLKKYEVQRFSKINIKGKKLLVSNQDPTLSICDINEEAIGLKCIVFQHEIDHAYGKLISDIGKQVFIHRS